MEKLKLFLVGGFLGSGKTTAIQQAARCLIENNKKAGIITNDQGVLLVDTAFMKGQAIPTAEVSGGCFCCQYYDLEDRIEWLRQTAGPEIIFAESAGSCVDLAATVVNPLLSGEPDRYDVVLSVFADSRLLLAFLQADKPALTGNVNYIYANQLSEADILVVNKVDLLSEAELEWVKQQAGRKYGDKIVLFQNSLSEQSVSHWLAVCEAYSNRSLRPALDLDYDIYGAGEAELAWLDEEIGILSTDGIAISAAYELMRALYHTITDNGLPIGHLKFLLDDGREQIKVSFTTVSGQPPDERETKQADRVDRAVVTVNARVQAGPEVLRQMMSQTILDLETRYSCRIVEYGASAFQPGYPRPTHRIAEVT